MPTGTDICTSALLRARVTGVGNPPSADQISRSLILLNDILALWSSKRWLNYAEIDHVVAVTGQQSYTIGPGGDIDVTARPDRIEYGFVRLNPNNSELLSTTNIPIRDENGDFILTAAGNVSLPVDYSLRQIMSREDYSRVTLKTLQSFPYAFFYDSGYPLGKIYPLPIPNNPALYELHFGTRTILPVLSTPATSISLPPEYTYAMRWNLASEIRAEWGLPADPSIDKKAQDGRNTIRSSNIQVASLSMPSGLAGSGGWYNPFSDTVTNVTN